MDSPEPLARSDPAAGEKATARQARTVALWLALGYVGIYLCRQNYKVAVPLLQTAFGVDKAHVGIIASVGSFAYMAGKFISGPVADRIGGRASFLIALVGGALFGTLVLFAP